MSEEAHPTHQLRSHFRRIEALRELIRSAIELEAVCELSGGLEGRQLNEEVFHAHFGEWVELLEHWDALIEEKRVAPDPLWAKIASECAAGQLQEPPFSLGALIDRLAIILIRRAREWQLGGEWEPNLRLESDRIGGAACWTLYLEGERVARIAGEAEDALRRHGETIVALIRRLEHSEEARAISDNRDAILELKQYLLERFVELAAEPVQRANGCPVCEADATEVQAVSPTSASSETH